MPHVFNAHPNHPAVPYLVRLHADLGGQILANKEEGARLAEAMRHVEAVIKLFNPDYSVKAISARRRQNRNPWFKRGTMFRYALDALREAGKPMTVRDLTDAVLAARNIADVSKKQHSDLQAVIRSCLERNAGKTVQRVDQSVPRRWRLAQGT